MNFEPITLGPPLHWWLESTDTDTRYGYDTIRYGYGDTTKFEKLGYGYGGDTFIKNIILTIFSNAVCIKIKLKAKDNLIKKKDSYKTKSLQGQ